MSYDIDLIDCPVTFDPEKSDKLREVFRNPKARALWMAYRRWHLVDQYTSESLPVNCLEMAQEIDNLSPKEIKGKDFIQPLLSDELSIANRREAIKSWSNAELAQWLAGYLMAGSHYSACDSFIRGSFSPLITRQVLTRMAGGNEKEEEKEADAFRFAVFIRPYLLGEKIATYKIIKEEAELPEAVTKLVVK